MSEVPLCILHILHPTHLTRVKKVVKVVKHPSVSPFREISFSGAFIAYSDLFGPANAAQLDALVLQKR